jgi:photosystem II stability/assembly factor-like uncharacterized protein
MKDFADFDNTTGAFPDVLAQNATGSGTTDGTPINEDVVNDVWGFFQALLNEADATPSGDCEANGASQLLNAIKTVIAAVNFETNRKRSLENVFASELNSTAAWTDIIYAIIGSKDYAATSQGFGWLALGAEGLQSSPIGISKSWVERTVVTSPPRAGCLVNESALTYIIVGAAGGIETSTDLASWTARTADGGYTDTFYAAASAAYAAGKLAIVVGENGEIQTSDDDGATWTARTPAASYGDDFRGAAFGLAGVTPRMVIVGEGGEIQYSDDGTTWTHADAAATYTGTFYAIAWGVAPDGAYVWVAVGEDNEIQYSHDGITWQHVDAPTMYGDDLLAIAFGSAGFVAVGLRGNVCHSRDGISWARAVHNSDYGDDYDFRAIGSDFTKYVIGGDCNDGVITYLLHTLNFEDLVY